MIRFKEWGAFLFLGVFAWGTSFLWIKVGVQEIGPFTLVAYRLAFGVLAIWFMLWIQGIRYSVERQILFSMILLGMLNTAIPFILITWSEVRIDSGLAGILNGTAPLFTILIGHLFLLDERIKPSKVLGLVIGFFGLILLLSRDIGTGGSSGNLWGQAATLVASVLYAISSVFIRRHLNKVHPVVIAATAMTSAFVVLAILAPIFESPFEIPQKPITWIAVAWLGVIGTALAYQIYFYLIRSWGPTRSILVTYVFPIVAVFLGVIFLHEELNWRFLLGGALIVCGIAAVNYKSKPSDSRI